VLLSCAVALVVARRESAVLLARPRWRPDAARAVCAYGMPLAGTLGLMWILDASDRLLLYAFLGPEAAGRYAVAYDIAARPIAMTMAGVAFAVLPLLSRAYEEGGAGGARTLFGFAAIILLAIGLPVTVLEAALARDISQVVLGAQYAGAAAEIIPIIAVASFLSGVRLYYLDYNHHLSKRTMTLAIEWAAAAVANVLLNLLLIPRFGAPGAAYATLLAYALLHLTYLVSRDRNIPLAFPMREIAKVALAAATMTIPLSMDLAGPPWLRLLLTGSAAASLYVVVLYASNLAGLRTWVNTRITAMTVSA